MPAIFLQTRIKSTIEICFDLSRSIDLHQISTVKSNEKAIDGKTKGLIEHGEFVTWQAIHFGIKQKLSSEITEFKRPFHFRDEQLKGAFKYIIHDHYFEQDDGTVMMKDSFKFQSPYGFIGKIFDKTILKNYMTKLLIERNQVIRAYAESGKWELILNN